MTCLHKNSHPCLFKYESILLVVVLEYAVIFGRILYARQNSHSALNQISNVALSIFILLIVPVLNHGT